MTFDPDRDHRRSIRIANYDYTQPGAYYVTITTKERKCIFGEIQAGETHLNKIGILVRQEWERLPKRFDHLDLGAFVIMPNHLHGIIIISRRDTGKFEIANNGQLSPRVLTAERFGAPVERLHPYDHPVIQIIGFIPMPVDRWKRSQILMAKRIL